MSTKKKASPRATVPTMKTYDLDTLLGTHDGGGFGGGDELDDALRQARKLQADKLKTTILKKTQLELEKEVKDLERDVGTGSGGGSITQEDIQFLSQLPEDQRATAIQAMAAFKGQSGGSNSTGSLAPMLIMSMLQKQPQTGVTELVTALKGLNDIVQTGKPPTNNVDSVVSVARLLLEFKDKDQVQVTELYKQLLQDRNVDPLQQTESVINLAKALGMAPSGGMSPEIERMKIENERVLQKSDQEFRLLIAKMEKDDKRMEGFINMITEVAKPFAERAGAAFPALLGAGAATVSQVKPVPQVSGPLSVRCACGYEPIWVSEETPVAVCPNCGARVTHEKFKDRVQSQGGDAPQPPSTGMPPPPSG